MSKEFPVFATEMGLAHYPCKEMEGWRYYRLEYGGVNEDCVLECGIWLPSYIDIKEIEFLVNGKEDIWEGSSPNKNSPAP